MIPALTTVIWDWFLGDGRATVVDRDGTLETADWHLRTACGVDTTSSLPVPAVLPEDRSPAGVATPGTLAKGVSCRCGHITADLFTTAMLPLADLLAQAQDAEPDREVFLVYGQDADGDATVEGVFATEEIAREYTAQFADPDSTEVVAQTVETVAPRRYTTYMLTAILRSQDEAAAMTPYSTQDDFRPLVNEFDESAVNGDTRTTEPVTLTSHPMGKGLAIRVVGTDRAKVIAVYCAAVNHEREHARVAPTGHWPHR